jgi:hypothetical protein
MIVVVNDSASTLNGLVLRVRLAMVQGTSKALDHGH